MRLTIAKKIVFLKLVTRFSFFSQEEGQWPGDKHFDLIIADVSTQSKLNYLKIQAWLAGTRQINIKNSTSTLKRK